MASSRNLLIEGRAGARARLLGLALVPIALFYFAWLLQPDRIGHPVLYAVLVVAELFNLAQALGFWWTCAHDRDLRPPRRAEGTDADVDVLIPVYDEPVDIVEPTVAAAVRMRGARVHVALLDDGDSPEMEKLAARYRVAYVRRAGSTGAKAGNLNNALGTTNAPFVAVFDCDHVPDQSFLQRTLGHFDDDRVAYVQTPQYYANAPETGGVCAAAWAQQALFFGPISRGKDGLGSMFCCGTNMVFRRSALEDIGGFPERSLTEDFEMSVTLHERGYRSVYVPEILARGLGPEDMASYVSQQHRWARGCLSAIPRVLRARLPLRLRLQYLLSAMYFLTGWTVLVYVTLPVVRLLTGAQPLAESTADQFLLHFAPYFGMALLAVSLFGRGLYAYDGFALSSASFWVHVRALLGLVLRRPAGFTVTPKKGAARRQPRAVAPTLAVIALLAGAAVFGLVHDREPATWNNVAFAAMHIALLTTGAWPALVRGTAAAREDPRLEREPAVVAAIRERPAAPPIPGGVLVAALAERIDEVLEAVVPSGSRCALLDFPNHSNCGDSAIWLGEARALQRRSAQVVWAGDIGSFSPGRVAGAVGDGIILLHGGGNLGDLYPRAQAFREEVISAFPSNPIVQLPQSLHFEDSGALERAKRVFGSHPDLTLLVRDERSLAFARKHFDVRTMLCPDAALALGHLERRVPPARDIVWLSRTDQESAGPQALRLDRDVERVDWLSLVPSESHFGYGSLAATRAATRAAGRLSARFDVSAVNLSPIYDRVAQRNVARAAHILGRGRVVLTDRLHGHIISLLLGIPHVVIGDAHGKTRAFFETWTERSDISWWVDDVREGLELARYVATDQERLMSE